MTTYSKTKLKGLKLKYSVPAKNGTKERGLAFKMPR